MGNLTNFPYIALAIAATLIIASTAVVNGQPSSNGPSPSNSLCTGAMMRSFNPCISFLTGGGSSSNNGGSSSPTSGCCSSLKDLMSNGQDCLCLILTGGVPLQIPINRNLAMSLPRACKMSGVPIQCNGTGGSPVPSPDPGSPDQGQPNLSPGLSPPSPTSVPFLPQPFTPPSSTGGGLTPPLTPPGGDVVPTLTPPGMRPTLDPSGAAHQSVWSSVVAAAALGVTLMEFLIH